MSLVGTEPFERSRTLTELLPAADRARLTECLCAILGVAFRIVDPEGGLVVGGDTTATFTDRHELRWELERVGFLEVDTGDAGAVDAALEWLQLVFKANARYLMAADLHHTVSQSDYEALQRKHRDLQRSEARYRELSEALEQRVEEQVKTIETTQRSLYQTEKLASVGRLAAGVAHEINNPIGFVRSNLNSARDYLRTLDDYRRFIEGGEVRDAARRRWNALELDEVLEDFSNLLSESVEGADRVARIVKDLKLFSRVDQAENESFDLNEVLRGACGMIATQCPPDMELVASYTELPPISGNPALVGEAFFNLLQNAVQAVERAGRVVITSVPAADRAVVSIEDNGRGIPEEVRDRVFDPFFTTRGVGAGTGLGLTVANDVVRNMGGELALTSEVGRGTKVTVRLPLATVEVPS